MSASVGGRLLVGGALILVAFLAVLALMDFGGPAEAHDDCDHYSGDFSCYHTPTPTHTADAHSQTNGDSHPQADAHSQADGDAHPQYDLEPGVPQADGHSQTNGDSHPQADGHSQADGDTHPQADGHSQTNGDSHSEAHRKRQLLQRHHRRGGLHGRVGPRRAPRGAGDRFQDQRGHRPEVDGLRRLGVGTPGPGGPSGQDGGGGLLCRDGYGPAGGLPQRLRDGQDHHHGSRADTHSDQHADTHRHTDTHRHADADPVVGRR